MAAPKGHPRYGGREKDTPNKLTQTFQAIYKDTIQGEQERIGPAFKAVYDKDKFKYLLLLEKYLSYVLPKQSSATIGMDETMKGAIASIFKPFQEPTNQDNG